jgi:hypothetical protein
VNGPRKHALELTVHESVASQQDGARDAPRAIENVAHGHASPEGEPADRIAIEVQRVDDLTDVGDQPLLAGGPRRRMALAVTRMIRCDHTETSVGDGRRCSAPGQCRTVQPAAVKQQQRRRGRSVRRSPLEVRDVAPRQRKGASLGFHRFLS